jgi:hypothetical protein
MSVNRQNRPPIHKQSQETDNWSFDEEYQVYVNQMLGYDGQSLQRMPAKNMAIKIQEVGSITYVALAAPGTLQSDDKWQVRKIDESSGVVVTWAGGNADFVHVATDLGALTYS